MRHGRDLDAARGDDVRGVDVDAVASFAAAQLAAAVQLFVPRGLRRAVMDDPGLVWSWPLGAGPWHTGALPLDVRYAAHDAETRDVRLGAVPPGFALDPRYGYERDDMTAGLPAGTRWVEPWSQTWPDTVSNEAAFGALRATRIPEAVVVADARRRVIYAGPSTEARIRAAWQAPHTETAQGRTARIVDIVRRFGERFAAEGYAVSYPGGDVSEGERPFVSTQGDGWYLVDFDAALAAYETNDDARALLLNAGETIIGEFLRRWDPCAVAHVLAATARVEARVNGAAMVVLPASKASRVPFDIMARAESFAPMAPTTVRGGYRVRWDGRPSGEQLSLAFALRAPSETVFREILRAMRFEGLRDYVILHRIAGEQGRTGRFRWTWEAHKRATLHDARVRNSTMTDDEARAEVTERIWRLAGAELHAEVYDGDRRAWRVVGDAPLVSVVGGVEHGRDLEALYLSLNPALYEGAGHEGRRYFTQLPEAVLQLPALPFALGVMLAFRWRYERDDGGAVEIGTDELHALMDDARARVGNRAAAAKTLRNTLAAVTRAMGEGCAAVDLGGDRWRITPPRAWVDAVVHEALPAMSAAVPRARALAAPAAPPPRTGAELAAWRAARGLSQTAAASALGVSPRTVKYAESDPAGVLGRAFSGAPWGAVAPVEGGGRGIARPAR